MLHGPCGSRNGPDEVFGRHNCFGFTRKNIQDEIAERGRSAIGERITAEVKAGNCACEVKNPSGKCCLGSVTQIARDCMRNLQGAATKIAG